MRIRSKPLVLAVCAVAIFAGVAPIWASEYEDVLYGTPKALDGLVLRPLAIISAAVGAAIFVVTLPFSAPTGSVSETGDELVMDPLRFAFQRPMGEETHASTAYLDW